MSQIVESSLVWSRCVALRYSEFRVPSFELQVASQSRRLTNSLSQIQQTRLGALAFVYGHSFGLRGSLNLRGKQSSFVARVAWHGMARIETDRIESNRIEVCCILWLARVVVAAEAYSTRILMGIIHC